MMMVLKPLHWCASSSNIPPKPKTPTRRESRDPKQRTHDSNSNKAPLIGLSVAHAHFPFDEIPVSDTFAWNALIRSHLADGGDPRHAVLAYHHMLLRGARPDKHTIPRVIASARLSGSLFEGRQVHCHALKLGLAADDYVVTALMELHGQLGGGADAAAVVFNCSSRRNSVSGTLLAKLYAAEERPEMALRVFHGMASSGIEFDSVALAMASKSCGQLKSLSEGQRVYELARANGLEADVLVGNSLSKMYIDCEKIDEARALFDRMPVKDAVSWTTIIGGYVQRGSFNEGLKLFRLMCVEGVKPDAYAVSAILPACSRMAAHKTGREIHGHIVRNHVGGGMNPTVQNALMDMYVKSGGIDAASKVFGSMAAETKDAISWTVMILGNSLHGRGELGVALFHEMESKTRLPIDTMVLTAALHACSTACMVEEGRQLFDRITKPKVEHFALMAGLLSRAGLFEDARRFVDEQCVGRHAEVHRAVLAGCRTRRNVKLGKRIAEQLIELEPLNAENYVLLSNVYAANGDWDKVKELREMILDMGLKPKRAWSWIEIRNKVHVLGVGDVGHPRSERIYWELQSSRKKVEEEEEEEEEEGYVAGEDDDFSLHDVDEERECAPYGHSEMLAMALGLISTQGSTTIRVTKNLHVCRSCHALGKMMSKVPGREIVLKEPGCFHHFKDGLCSCRDIW